MNELRLDGKRTMEKKPNEKKLQEDAPAECLHEKNKLVKRVDEKLDAPVYRVVLRRIEGSTFLVMCNLAVARHRGIHHSQAPCTNSRREGDCADPQSCSDRLGHFDQQHGAVVVCVCGACPCHRFELVNVPGSQGTCEQIVDVSVPETSQRFVELTSVSRPWWFW